MFHLSLGSRDQPQLARASFRVVVESAKVSPELLFLQAEHAQPPQHLLTRLILQTLAQLCCPSLGMLKHVNVFIVTRGLTLK